MMTKPNAASELSDSESMGDSMEDNASDKSGTFFLPPDFLSGKTYKKGDTITLTVIGEDQDGDVEVSLAAGGDNSQSMADDLRASLSEPSTEGGQS